MMRPTFIALGNEESEVCGEVRTEKTEQIIIRRKPTFIELVKYQRIINFRYCDHCKFPLLDMEKNFCSENCKTLFTANKKVKNMPSEIKEKLLSLMLAAVVFVAVWAIAIFLA